MHDLVIVTKIQNIEPIEGKDRIVLATVANYKSIIAKDEFEVGDLVVYCTYDTCLPTKPEFEFLRKRCYNARLDMFRIRPMKMGGVISEGLVLPLSILPEGNYKNGQVVTDLVGAKNYEDLVSVEVNGATARKPKWRMKYKILRKIFGKKVKKEFAYPCPKSDEENIEKAWDGVKGSTETFYRSAKAEGCAATYYVHKKKLYSFSHNFYNAGGCWGEVAKIYDLKNGLVRLNKKLGTEVAIQGEICGPGIQKNIYGFTSYKFFLYGAYDTKTGRRMNIDELHEIAKVLGVLEVIYLEPSKILNSVDDMLEDAVRPSVYNPSLKYEEGVVWRNYTGSIHFKCKSRPYKVWFGD